MYPKSKGGTMKSPACMDCNMAKENKLPIEWALYASEHNLDIATIPIGAELLQAEIDCMDKTDLLQQIASLIAAIAQVKIYD